MAVAEMRKVTLIGEIGVREKIIKKLGDAGIFQSVPPSQSHTSNLFKKSQVDVSSLEDNITKLEETINFLTRFEEEGFSLGLFPTKVVVNAKERNRWIRSFNWEKVYEKCKKIENRLIKLDEESQSLKEELENLSPWKNMPSPLRYLKEKKYIDFQLAILPYEAKPSLLKLTQKEEICTQVFSESGRKIYTLFIFLKEKRSKVEEILQKLRGEKQKISEDILPSSKIEEIKTREEEIEKEKEKLLEEAKKLTEEKVKLMVVHDYFYDLLQERKVQSHSQLGRYTFFLQGWIRKDDTPVLKKILSDFPQVDAVITKPSKKEESHVPVALSNPKIFKPFELVTELYGLPRYVEIDPTPFLAPFFALFLALCLTDGGYGLILAILSFIIPRKMYVGEGGKKLFSILFISGLVTLVVGTITGGIFGVQVSDLPDFLAPVKKLVLFNPMEEPMIFLALALALGIIHLLIAIAIEMRDNLRKKDIASAFLDQFSWIVLIIGLLLVGAPFVKGFLTGGGEASSPSGGISLTFSPSQMFDTWKILPLYSKVGSVMSLGTMIVLFLFSGRKSKNLGIRLGKGAYELYGIIQLFGDVLSYSRLLALGLATSVIATVVNTIAKMAGGIPVLGPVAFVFILIFGHLGNLVINCLSGFIHTSRLQFVEFFTKFYESGGKKFEPLRREGKYTIVKG